MKELAFTLFAQGTGMEQVATATNRALSTVWEYLADFIVMHRPQQIDSWIDQPTYNQVAAAVAEVGAVYLKPIFERLGGKVPYGQIRAVVTHLEVTRIDLARRK